jgi:hypothetical protein
MLIGLPKNYRSEIVEPMLAAMLIFVFSNAAFNQPWPKRELRQGLKKR